MIAGRCLAARERFHGNKGIHQVKAIFRRSIQLSVALMILAVSEITVGPLACADVGRSAANPPWLVALSIHASRYPTHTHKGTTRFNRFVKVYPFDWRIADRLADKLTQRLRESERYAAIRLSAQHMSQPALTDYHRGQMGVRIPIPLPRIHGGSRLLILIPWVWVSVTETQSTAMKNCTLYGCLAHTTRGYGLFTRSFLVLDRYIATASFEVTVTVFDRCGKVVNIHRPPELNQVTLRNRELTSLMEPANFYHMTEREMASVKLALYDYADSLATRLVHYLHGIQPPTQSSWNDNTSRDNNNEHCSSNIPTEI